MSTKELIPLDVWLRIPEGEEESEAEANVFAIEEGFRADWYLTSVGLVSSRIFQTYDEATSWLTAQGFEDYSS